MNAAELRERLRKDAEAIGLDAFGVAPIDADVRADYFKEVDRCGHARRHGLVGKKS